MRLLDEGCSSLGRLRFAVLLGVGKKHHQDGGLCLVDIKEAVQAAAPHCPGASMPRDNAQRVVVGAQRLSPALGERMLAARFLGKGAFLRELMPEDLKLEIDTISREEAMDAARYLAMVVGVAHARQMSALDRPKWLEELGRHRTTSLDAPSWLWSSVLELIASHKVGYLNTAASMCPVPLDIANLRLLRSDDAGTTPHPPSRAFGRRTSVPGVCPHPCFGLSGGFAPMIRPAFQGRRGRLNRSS